MQLTNSGSVRETCFDLVKHLLIVTLMAAVINWFLQNGVYKKGVRKEADGAVSLILPLVETR